ncbi:hypothetical protein CS542_07060 [Pedobacter sp. IW39]|nr:hypothetical protein CS542_07060 [Pedobacter sp. IW39]
MQLAYVGAGRIDHSSIGAGYLAALAGRYFDCQRAGADILNTDGDGWKWAMKVWPFLHRALQGKFNNKIVLNQIHQHIEYYYIASAAGIGLTVEQSGAREGRTACPSN